MSKFVPTAPEVVKEAILIIAAALLAAAVMRQFPALRQFIKDNIGTVPV